MKCEGKKRTTNIIYFSTWGKHLFPTFFCSNKYSRKTFTFMNLTVTTICIWYNRLWVRFHRQSYKIHYVFQNTKFNFQRCLFFEIRTLVSCLKSTLLLKLKCFDTHIYMKTQCLQTNEMQHYLGKSLSS